MEYSNIMKIEQTHIDHIRTAFQNMKSREDFLHLLNEAKPLVYGEKTIPFELKQLSWYSNPKLAKKRYTEFKVKKKSGAERTIHAPVNGLKAIQKTLSFILQSVYEPHKAATGFVKEKSIVDNAKEHVGNKYLYNIDLKDFFPSIDQARVWKCMQLKPFNLTPSTNENLFEKEITEVSFEKIKEVFEATHAIIKETKIGSFLNLVDSNNGNKVVLKIKIGSNAKISGTTMEDKIKDIKTNHAFYLTKTKDKTQIRLTHKDEFINNIKSISLSKQNIANMIASLCCTAIHVERKNAAGEWETVVSNVLPQGAPTSPVLSNVICQRLDYLLSAVAKRFGLKYTRYADDMTFSSMHNVYQPESDFLKELHRIVADQGFHIKESKTRLQKEGFRQEVTGLLVNEKVNVQKRYIKQLRMWLYYWESYGYDRAQSFFQQQYIADKGFAIKGRPDMINVIDGKLNYLKMVKGDSNDLYLKLRERFDNLITKKINPKPISEVEIKTVTDTNQVKITLEVYQSPEMNVKLNNSINIPKDTILPNTIIVPNLLDDKNGVKMKLNNLYPILHTPIKTVALLKYFTANDKDLKYSTHSWEEGKYNSYEEYIEKIRLEWNEIKDDLKNQSQRLFSMISNFLFNSKLGQKNEKGYHNVWGEKRLKFGWSSPELKIHMSELGNSPFSCPIPENIKELEKINTLYYFKDYADIFKNEIEFREDSNNFKMMILDLWESELSYDFNVKGIEQLVGFSFFTDVHHVKDALRILFRDMFKGKPEFSQVIIEKTSNFENGGYHLIKITQKDSYITRDINDPKLTSPTGNLFSIISNLKNLADYSIVSRFSDGKNYRLNYLASSKTEFVEILTPEVNVLGFTHELKFYLL